MFFSSKEELNCQIQALKRSAAVILDFTAEIKQLQISAGPEGGKIALVYLS